MTVAETIKKLQEHFNPEAAAGLNKILQLNLSGDEEGKWAIKIANKACELIPGGVEKPDLTLSLADKDWIAIVEGKLNPMTAYMTGKLKANGDIALATRIASIFGLK
jgi:putative sterol carrier protein